MSDPASDFNKVLDQVLNLTQTVVEGFHAAEHNTVAWHVCRGKLIAMHQVIDFFSAIDAKKFVATN